MAKPLDLTSVRHDDRRETDDTLWDPLRSHILFESSHVLIQPFRIACLILVGFGGVACGQEPNADAQKPQLDGSELTTLRARLLQSQVSEEEQQQVLAVIDQGESLVKEFTSQQTLVKKRTDALATVSQRVESTKREIASLVDFKPKVPAAPLPELEAGLATLEADLVVAKAAVADAEAAMAQATNRPREIEKQLPELQKKLDEIKAETPLNAASGTTLLAEAKRIEASVSKSLLETRVAALRAELALIEAESAASLPQLMRDLHVRTVETLEEQLASTKQVTEELRAKEADSLLESASAQLSQLHLSLQPIGKQNQTLALTNQSLTTKIEETESALKRQKLQLEGLKGDFQQAKNRLEAVGLTEAVGSMLRSLRQKMPHANEYQLRNRERQNTINEAQYALIDLVDERNRKLDVIVARLFRDAEKPVSLDEQQRLEPKARELFREQRTEFLDPAIRSQKTYFNALVSLSTTDQQIVDAVKEATRYIDERVLWIRSTTPLMSQMKPSREESWFLMPSSWQSVRSKLLLEFDRQYPLWIAAFLLLIGLLRFRMLLRREIQSIGQQVTQSGYTSFAPTMKSLLLTTLTAAPLPLVAAFLGWRLREISGDDRVTIALANAATTLAVTHFPLELFRQVCRAGGLAESHFGMVAKYTTLLGRNLRWLIWTTVPLLTLASFLDFNNVGFGRDTLSRYMYVAAMASICVFMVRVFHPRKGVFENFLHAHQNGWANRLSYFWYPVLVGIPIALAVLAIFGYYFTSEQLALRLHQSLCLLLVIGLTSSIVLRWAMLHRRRLRIEQARARIAADNAQSISEVPVTLPDASPEELSHQVQQTRQMLQTSMFAVALIGMWMIWSAVLPAFDLLERWPLWQSTETITESVPTDDGGTITRTRDVIDNVTIAELGFAALMFGVAVVAIRNIPGLLDFAVLRRLPLDHSTRYAITTLVSYAIALIGLIVACGAIGLHWNQVQWMATALTFGLAFGLQEMFANFIAGIIILFEQPVRVGDIVEIDGVSGVVTRIRIRATTITSWDRKDYIVPNKEFITGKLLNWTRSDEVARISIGVGVAYGSDTDQARALLLKVACDHQDVLVDPAPMAIFDEFGDSSLMFILRAFVSSYDKRLSVRHDLHTGIDKAFREANIEISFPQLDLNVRQMPESFQPTPQPDAGS
ncbi:MAG: mechanosensitive ion channel domain-containing protein [Rubripirellula sp.]